jgi:hypothetical protein
MATKAADAPAAVDSTNSVALTIATNAAVSSSPTNSAASAVSTNAIVSINSTNAPAPITRVGPPSSWVKPQFFNRQSSFGALDSGADDQVLLLENQINPAQNEIFVHSARRILTMTGVQKKSMLTTDFNPAYQSLTLHWARLWRGDQHLDRLDTNRLKVVQPEREMDQFVLNGQHSTILVLDDVRVGDIIDYAYSVKGENPVLGGHFSADIPVQLEQSADRLLARVVWPSQRHLYAKVHGCEVQPAVTVGKESIEYTWDVRQIPGLTLEDELPGWYDPQPWVQLSEFRTWAEVNQWAAALFRGAGAFSPELARQIANWKRIQGQEERTLAVLRFVQDQVRYFGIEIGASAEKPGDPSAVFARRFGDCKDKSLLFVAILRTLGIEAYPVLVNTVYGRAIAEWQPSAGIFDHCIAVAVVNGQNYWLDPTMNYQRGPLAAHYVPNYGCGLVISARTAALTAIPQVTGLPRTTTSEYFQIRGVNEAADLRVVTVSEGRDAEILRRLFAETKRGDIEKHYTHFYSDLYPGIHMAAPIVFEDDEQQNKVQTTESYSINGAWAVADKTGKYRCEFYPATIADRLRTPVHTDRRSPLGVEFPEHQFLHTEVTLPSAWPADAGKESISDPAFVFEKAYRCVGNKLLMEYQYQASADSVPPDRVTEYLQRVNQSSQLLGYSLTWR